jgi:4a-hydroxytetrahydrobiopterin dehydratase
MTPVPLLTGDEIAARLIGLNWTLEGETIVRDLKFEDFAAAIAFVDRVAELAETHNHHPDILVHGWNKVKLSLSNHAAGGLTEIDFEMAARFDALPGASSEA